MKIEKLTKEQEKKLIEYRDEGLRVGLSTETFTHGFAKPRIDSFYEIALKREKPKHLIIMDSPISAWLATCFLAQVRNQVEDQVRVQVWDQVGVQVRDQVGAQVRNQVGAQVLTQVLTQAWDQIRAQVGDQVRNQVGAQVKSFIWPYFAGRYEPHWIKFYMFFLNELKCKIDKEKELRVLNSTLFCDVIYPLINGFCIISKNPTAIKMLDKKLHNPTGPSIEYADGFKIYSLFGVRVPEKYFTKTPTPKEILAEKNAEVRMVLIKRAGIETMLSELDTKVLDSKDEYELIGIRLVPDGRYCEYLKMVNPSTGSIHVEGVAPDTKTVTQALMWRNNMSVYTNPIVGT